jgi:hypothetical protein
MASELAAGASLKRRSFRDLPSGLRRPRAVRTPSDGGRPVQAVAVRPDAGRRSYGVAFGVKRKRSVRDTHRVDDCPHMSVIRRRARAAEQRRFVRMSLAQAHHSLLRGTVRFRRLAILGVSVVSLLAVAPLASAAPDCDEYNTSRMCDPDQPEPSHDPFGAVDFAETSWSWNTGAASELTVRGWAIDPDTDNPIDVRIDVVDGWGTYSVTATANLVRPGLHRLHLSGDNHGFHVSVPLRYPPWGSYTVTAINVDEGWSSQIGEGYWINS